MQKKTFNHNWRFHPGTPPGYPWQEPDDTTWRTLDLPHDWSIELDRSADQPCGSAGGYFPTGVGWYHKTFTAPPDWQGKKVFVEFEGVYMNAEIWLNEHLITRHPYGYTSFLCDLTPYLTIGAENKLKVSVDNSQQLNSRWYSGSGIYRPVWLIVAEPVHIAHWGVFVTTPRVSAQAATVRIATRVQNESGEAQSITLRSRILAPDGSPTAEATAQLDLPAAGEQEKAHNLTLSTPRLWSLENPHLYRLESELLLDGKVIDSQTTPFGIRSLEFDAEKGFRLNGKPLKLRGGCVHHDNGILGAASHPRSEERKVELLKASGFNAIRCAHNPPAPALLDACDRLGMLVIDEAFDCWRMGKNPYDYHVVFEDWWQRDLDSMLLRDRNHPSIIIWSIGNELVERDGRSNGVATARLLAERVRSLDPTRPVTDATNGDNNWPWERTDAILNLLDIGGYNYQFRQYEPDHERYPQRMMIGTESAPKEMFENWELIEKHPFILGDFVWTSLDYLGEAGIGRQRLEDDPHPFMGAYPWHQANCGDLDLCGFKRPQSYYRDILWGRGDPLYLGVRPPAPAGKTITLTYWGWEDLTPSWTWAGHEGQPMLVEVYSACEKVELFLNGKSLGVKPTSRAEKYRAAWEVPYKPGELRVKGYKGKRTAATCSLKTPGSPAAIRLTADREIIPAGGDLSFVTAEVLDKDGEFHPAAGNLITFTVEGAGSLLAVGSGNPVSEERYVGNERRAFRGRCLAVVKSGAGAGEIRLRAAAEGLEPAEITIQVQG